MALSPFHFKKFSVEQAGAVHPVGTDAVLLGACANLAGISRFLDIGTGTGVVALMLAQRLSDAGVGHWSGTGVEIHSGTADLARRNFQNSPWAPQLAVWEGPIQQFSATEPFDFIVSNPPFFSEKTKSPDPTRHLGRHTDSLSSEDLLQAVNRLLSENGRFWVVLPTQEAQQLCALAVPIGLYWTHIVDIFSRPDKPPERQLIQFERINTRIQRSKLLLFAHAKGNTYSTDFQALTEGFYL